MPSPFGLFQTKTSRSPGGDILVFLTVLMIAVIMFFPMVFIISAAFKPLNEFFLFPPRMLVQNPTLENFQDLFTAMTNSWIPLTRYTFNSLLVTTVGTSAVILISCLAAYPLSKLELPFKKTLFSVIIITLMLSSDVAGITNYILLNRLGLIDTYLVTILPALAYPFGVFLLKQFIDEMVQDSLLESARIDGAGEPTILATIVMPMIKPAWLTLLIFTLTTFWNDQGGYIYTEQLKPLPFAMNQILAGGIARAGAGSAAAVLLMIVPITTFVIAQSRVVETLAKSGIKE